MSNLPIILKYLRPFKEHLFVEPIERWGRQWGPWSNTEKRLLASVRFKDQRKNRTMGQQEWINHFEAKPAFYKGSIKKDGVYKDVDGKWGSYGLSLNFSGIVKLACFDADNDMLMDLAVNELIPWLQQRDIDYIWEYSGEARNRGHFWILLDSVPQHVFSCMAEQIRRDLDKEKKEYFDEIYPYGERERSLIRLPGGLHTKTDRVNWGNVNGTDYEGLEEMFQAFLSLRPVPEEKIVSFLTEDKRERKTVFIPEQVNLDLGCVELTPPAFDHPLPPFIDKVSRKCQAMNKVLLGIKDEEMIEKRGQLYHSTGLALSGWSDYNDRVFKNEIGKEFFGWAVSELRTRPGDEHNWDYYWGQGPAQKLVTGCEKMEEIFGHCEGCEFKGQIKTPRQLFWAGDIERVRLKKSNLASLEDIRAEVFPAAEKLIDDALGKGEMIKILVDPCQNAGKSWWVDKYAVELVKRGLTVAISVHSADCAMEHVGRIRANGGDAFPLFGFDNVFEHKSNGITCPNFTEIKDSISLGMDSTYFKGKYCKKCPFFEDCQYPRQYTEVQEPEHKIVILQHAHLSCGEVARQLFRKNFDVLFIDEQFVDHLTTQIVPSAKEIELLETFVDDVPWIADILHWIHKGGLPQKQVKPSRADLKGILEAFRKAEIEYRLDKLVRQYNDGEYFHPVTGVMKFIPVPDVQAIVITDATPSLEELQIVFNTDDILEIGAEKVCDPRVYHPDNRVYQILDGRASKTQMLEKEELYEYLEIICDKMRTQYAGMLGLITVFKEVKQDTLEWILRNYPDVFPRVCVNHMAVGTNEFARFNVQFILAGPYISAKDYKKEVYKIKHIANYWRRLDGKELINNWFPEDLPDDMGGEVVWENVKRIMPDGVYEFPQHTHPAPPPRSWERLVHRRLSGAKQQAARIRHAPGKRTDMWFLDSDHLASMLVTNCVTKQSLLGAIRNVI